MKNIALFILCAVATVVALKSSLSFIAVPSCACALVFFVLALKQNQKASTQAHQEIVQTDAQLHKELVEAHFALIKLSAADDQRKGQVIELLLEAGKHLGQPVTNSRLVYGPDYFINWRREGLALVAQARQLIEGTESTNKEA